MYINGLMMNIKTNEKKMIDIKHYSKLFFNEETGKERYGLIQKEAELVGKKGGIIKNIMKSWEKIIC